VTVSGKTLVAPCALGKAPHAWVTVGIGGGPTVVYREQRCASCHSRQTLTNVLPRGAA
jgi:hypothetical protein